MWFYLFCVNDIVIRVIFIRFFSEDVWKSWNVTKLFPLLRRKKGTEMEKILLQLDWRQINGEKVAQASTVQWMGHILLLHKIQNRDYKTDRSVGILQIFFWLADVNVENNWPT